MQIKLKQAFESGWETIAKLEGQVKSKTFSSIVEEKDCRSYLSKSQVFFIYYKDQIVGTVSYELKDKEAEFDGLIVLPQYRGKGIAAEAIRQVLQKLGPDIPMSLFVHPENIPAIINYFRAGFVIKGWLNDHFGDGEPRLKMVRDAA